MSEQPAEAVAVRGELPILFIKSEGLHADWEGITKPMPARTVHRLIKMMLSRNFASI